MLLLKRVALFLFSLRMLRVWGMV